MIFPYVLFVGAVSLCLLLDSGSCTDLINISPTRYIKPGDDFKLECSGGPTAEVSIYTPHQSIPSVEEILEKNAKFGKTAEKTTTINDYIKASKEVHEGEYTCVVYHGGDADVLYSIKTCFVYIIDLCADSNCRELETCAPDYDTGTHECVCDYSHCTNDYAMFCSDTCENIWNECKLDELNCKDQRDPDRKKASEGFCPTTVPPTYMEMEQDKMEFYAFEGEEVPLPSGIDPENPGVPLPIVSWVFKGETLPSTDITYTIILTPETAGEYEATITQCRNASNARTIKITVGIRQEATVTPMPPSSPPDELTSGALPVCSVFPGGVIESFDGAGTYYDLACSHVLAADALAGDTYADSWFVYGTFDEFDGKSALRSMSIYVSVGFEIQRGWLVNVGGSKFILEEGVERSIDGTGCSITFADLHLKVDCVHFIVYYDGIMAGHILLKGVNMENTAIVKDYGSFGLCYDSQSGFRKNWQVGNTVGVCEVSTEAEACPDVDVPCDGLVESPKFGGASPATWGSCGNGATASCGELNCGDATPSVAQQCALNNANSANCNLKYGNEIEVDAACPDDCEWKNFVVDQGCPQENPPFECV